MAGMQRCVLAKANSCFTLQATVVQGRRLGACYILLRVGGWRRVGPHRLQRQDEQLLLLPRQRRYIHGFELDPLRFNTEEQMRIQRVRWGGAQLRHVLVHGLHSENKGGALTVEQGWICLSGWRALVPRGRLLCGRHESVHRLLLQLHL